MYITRPLGFVMIVLLLSFPAPSGGTELSPEVIHEHDGVDFYATNVFATPIAVWKDKIFVVGVVTPEGATNGVNHRTMIWEGIRKGDGEWEWKSRIVDRNTLADRYHTQPSVGVDRDGYLHVAYNMHNMPWQYAVSQQPADITTLESRGEQVDLPAKLRLKYSNKSHFPGMGNSPIPGNQVTYPAFFNDRKGRLYLTYRYALYPDRPFTQRTFSSALAVYDEETQTWSQVGGCLFSNGLRQVQSHSPGAEKSCPLASQPGWTAHAPRLWFDQNNTMHLVWLWRPSRAGPDGVLPSYAYRKEGEAGLHSVDRSRVRLPVRPEGLGSDRLLINAGNREQRYYMAMAVSSSSVGVPTILVSEYEGKRFLYDYNHVRGWRKSPSPYGATAIVTDFDDRLWAVATGPIVLSRSRAGKWKVEYEEKGWCYPKLFPHYASGTVYLHMQSCDLKRERVYLLNGLDIGSVDLERKGKINYKTLPGRVNFAVDKAPVQGRS